MQCTELMCWFPTGQHQSLVVGEQAQLIGVVVVVAIESDVEITDDVYRLLEDGGQLVEELLPHGDRPWRPLAPSFQLKFCHRQSFM